MLVGNFSEFTTAWPLFPQQLATHLEHSLECSIPILTKGFYRKPNCPFFDKQSTLMLVYSDAGFIIAQPLVSQPLAPQPNVN